MRPILTPGPAAIFLESTRPECRELTILDGLRFAIVEISFNTPPIQVDTSAKLRDLLNQLLPAPQKV
jgi:hypothetical protein